MTNMFLLRIIQHNETKRGVPCMKLNADIIFERLQRKYSVKKYGEGSKKPLLQRPELYMDNTLRFRADHVYLATADHLPHRPVIEKNVVLVCIGDSPQLSYYKEHATVLLIRQKEDFFEVYQTLQEIFDVFNDWESQLLQLFLKSADIQELLDCSYSVFECTLSVLDGAFQYVAASYGGAAPKRNMWDPHPENLELEDLLSYLHGNEMNMDRKGAFWVESDGFRILCVNLFDTEGEYIGCLYILYDQTPPLDGQEVFAEYLAAMIEKVCEINPVFIHKEESSLKNILNTMMQGMPLSKNQRLRLNTANLQQGYFCLSIHYPNRFSTLPVSYICSIFEGLLPDSVFFEHNNTTLGLVPAALLKKGEEIHDFLEKVLTDTIKDLQITVGISNEFRDLYQLNVHYLQAEAAIENGRIYRPERSIYLFSQFALYEMVANSLGRLPVESYFPKGFAQLMEHDQTGGISYLDTLMEFLNENMSYAKTARSLYIHRSTLIERISRIEKELEIDWDDPDQRLLLQLILKALHMEGMLRDPS